MKFPLHFKKFPLSHLLLGSKKNESVADSKMQLLEKIGQMIGWRLLWES